LVESGDPSVHHRRFSRIRELIWPLASGRSWQLAAGSWQLAAARGRQKGLGVSEPPSLRVSESEKGEKQSLLVVGWQLRLFLWQLLSYPAPARRCREKRAEQVGDSSLLAVAG
jgi:hypothetical protein